MITHGTGDLLLADVDALVNPVNTVGVMGKGLALQFKQAYPKNFRDYKASCARGDVTVGRMHVHEIEEPQPEGPRFIVNFPTKRHWRSSSRLEDIASGLVALRDEIAARGIRSVVVPPLGCGYGGLSWNDVEPMIHRTLGDIPGVEIRIWKPADAPVPSTHRPACSLP